MNNDVKLIVTDMDGTFLGAHGQLLEANAQAFREAARRGVHLAFASGRLPCMLSQFAMQLSLENCHMIGLNGAHVLERPFGQTVALHALPDEIRLACLNILREADCLFNVYTDGGLYTNRVLDAAEEQVFRKRFASCPRVVIGPDAADASLPFPCLKFFVRCGRDEAAYECAKQRCAQLPGVELTSSMGGTFEVMPAGIDKASAVGELAEGLGISMAQVMAFGDYDNDVAMLAACGHSVAMGNATEAAVAASVYQTHDHTQAGVAYAVHKWLDGQLETLRIR